MSYLRKSTISSDGQPLFDVYSPYWIWYAQEAIPVKVELKNPTQFEKIRLSLLNPNSEEVLFDTYLLFDKAGKVGGDISDVVRGLMRGVMRVNNIENFSQNFRGRIRPITPSGSESLAHYFDFSVRDYVDLLSVRGWTKIERDILNWGYKGVRMPSVVPFKHNNLTTIELVAGGKFAENTTYYLYYEDAENKTREFICKRENPQDQKKLPPFSTNIFESGKYVFGDSVFRAYEVPCDVPVVEVMWGCAESLQRALTWPFRLISIDYNTEQDVRSVADALEGGDRALRQRRSTQVSLTLQTIDEYTGEELAYFAPLFCGADVWVCADDIGGLGLDIATTKSTNLFYVDGNGVRASVKTNTMSLQSGTASRSRLTFEVDIYKYNNL